MEASDSHPPQGAMALGGRAVRLGRHVANHNAVILLLPVGLGIILIGAVDSSLSDQLRWLLALVGWAAAFLGFRAIGRLKWGNGFEPGLWLAIGWVAIVVLAAVFADFLPLAEALDTVKALTEPSRKRPELFSRHPLGTRQPGTRHPRRCDLRRSNISSSEPSRGHRWDSRRRDRGDSGWVLPRYSGHDFRFYHRLPSGISAPGPSTGCCSGHQPDGLDDLARTSAIGNSHDGPPR
mgnify:CR=1 FL=1